MPGNPNTLSNSATPEMLNPSKGLPIFFGWAERAHPQGVKDLVNLIGSMLPQGGLATAREVRDGLTRETLEIGFEAINSWLEDVGVGGFRQINVLKRKALLAGARAKGINLPDKEKISDEGIKVLKSFSACLKRAEGGERDAAKRVSPRTIVGDLLRESVGSRLSANGSAALRSALEKPLSGHFEWIREALGIADVAAQTGFTPKESAVKPVESAKREGPKRQSFFESMALTDVGKEREHNEDSILVNETDVVRSRGIDGVYILADGMGGHGAGEVASAIAADVVNQQVGKREFPHGETQFSQLTAEEQQEWLSQVVNQANHAIFERRKAATNTAEKDMGTTLVMAVRFGDQLMIANVGDSRAYIVSADGKTMTQISRDHSLVASLVAAGQITAAEARTHARKNEIYRAMGDKLRLDVDTFLAKIPAGGSLLLCSDGLWEMVEDDQIRQILLSSGTAQKTARRLIEAANAAGGEDNISAIVVRNISAERGQKQAEVDLTLTEKVFAAELEDLVGWEEGVGVIDSGKLQKAFENMRSQFGGLPAGGRFRAEVMETVMGQLGDEGEKMRKANKKDEQIFEEWLKRAFIPLYRRAVKK